VRVRSRCAREPYQHRAMDMPASPRARSCCFAGGLTASPPRAC